MTKINLSGEGIQHG